MTLSSFVTEIVNYGHSLKDIFMPLDNVASSSPVKGLNNCWIWTNFCRAYFPWGIHFFSTVFLLLKRHYFMFYLNVSHNSLLLLLPVFTYPYSYTVSLNVFIDCNHDFFFFKIIIASFPPFIFLHSISFFFFFFLFIFLFSHVFLCLPYTEMSRTQDLWRESE